MCAWSVGAPGKGAGGDLGLGASGAVGGGSMTWSGAGCAAGSSVSASCKRDSLSVGGGRPSSKKDNVPRFDRDPPFRIPNPVAASAVHEKAHQRPIIKLLQ